MAVDEAYVFPGFRTKAQPFFPKPPTTVLTCFCRGERRKYAGKKVRLNRGSNSQPPGYESDTLTTESPERGVCQRTVIPQDLVVCFTQLILWIYNDVVPCLKQFDRLVQNYPKCLYIV